MARGRVWITCRAAVYTVLFWFEDCQTLMLQLRTNAVTEIKSKKEFQETAHLVPQPCLGGPPGGGCHSGGILIVRQRPVQPRPQIAEV